MDALYDALAFFISFASVKLVISGARNGTRIQLGESWSGACALRQAVNPGDNSPSRSLLFSHQLEQPTILFITPAGQDIG